MQEQQIETILQAYGQVLQTYADKLTWGVPLALLPYAKPDIKKAVVLASLQVPEHDSRRLDLLYGVYGDLACFNEAFPDTEPSSNQERAERMRIMQAEQAELKDELVALQVRLSEVWRYERETQAAMAQAFAENSGAGTPPIDWRFGLAVLLFTLFLIAFNSG